MNHIIIPSTSLPIPEQLALYIPGARAWREMTEAGTTAPPGNYSLPPHPGRWKGGY